MSQWKRKAGQPAWMMGVLNCTPDSFSDGGEFLQLEVAVQHGRQLWDQGAALIDVGGESTRPGSLAVSAEEEIRRTSQVIQRLTEAGCQVSIDTMKAQVMREAIAAGAVMVNDVSALTYDDESVEVVVDSNVDVCLMHMQGTPGSMQNNPSYVDVVDDVCAYFEQRLACCLQAGMDEHRILLDPGIGFGKRLQDNLELIARLGVIRQRFGLPILMGVSRKSFLGMLTGAAVDDREIETAAAVSISIFAGADVLRIHDLGLQGKAIQIASALADYRAD